MMNIKTIPLRLNLNKEKDARVAQGLSKVNRKIYRSVNQFIIHALDVYFHNEQVKKTKLSQEIFLEEIERVIVDTLRKNSDQ